MKFSDGAAAFLSLDYRNPFTSRRTVMKLRSNLSVATAAFVTAIGAGLPANAAPARHLAIDQPTTINDVGLDCTRVGSDDAHPNIWRNYSVKLETVGGYGQYLANEAVSVRDEHGHGLFKIDCRAPWLMMKLNPGRYAASVDVRGAGVRDISFTAPKMGQRRVIARFDNMMKGREASSGELTKGSITNGTERPSRSAS